MVTFLPFENSSVSSFLPTTSLRLVKNRIETCNVKAPLTELETVKLNCYASNRHCRMVNQEGLGKIAGRLRVIDCSPKALSMVLPTSR